MTEAASWSTPPAPAAIALLRCPAVPALIDAAPPPPGGARLARFLGADGVAVDEVVVLDRGDGRWLVCTHGGPGVRAAIDAVLRAHGIPIAPSAGAQDDRWTRLARCPSPAALAWLLAGDAPPFDRVFLERLPLVLITGAPNAGKSSLLNAWCGHARAVVADEAGTTRDLVVAEVLHRGWRLRVVDSAGLRSASDPLERAGQDLVGALRTSADVVIRLDPDDASNSADDGALHLVGKADQRSIAATGLAWAIPERVGHVRSEAMLAALGDAVLERLGLPTAAPGGACAG